MEKVSNTVLSHLIIQLRLFLFCTYVLYLNFFCFCFFCFSIPKGSQEWSDTEITSFWKDFHYHTYNSFGIELGGFGMAHISLPDVAFNQEAVSL